MPEKIEEASECVELLILQKQIKVSDPKNPKYRSVQLCVVFPICVCALGPVWLEFQMC